MSCRFKPHTGIAVLDIVYNGFAHLWLPVVPRYKFRGSGWSRVTSSGMFVVGVEDLGLI